MLIAYPRDKLIDKIISLCYDKFMQKYNFLTWWLSFSIKPLPYKIFKSVITSVVFIIWVAFVAVFSDLYWQFTLYIFLPVFVIDTVWEIINFTNYQKKYKKHLEESKES